MFALNPLRCHTCSIPHPADAPDRSDMTPTELTPIQRSLETADALHRMLVNNRSELWNVLDAAEKACEREITALLNNLPDGSYKLPLPGQLATEIARIWALYRTWNYCDQQSLHRFASSLVMRASLGRWNVNTWWTTEAEPYEFVEYAQSAKIALFRIY